MNVIDLIHLAKVPQLNSKGDIKRLIKNNGLSIDTIKCKLTDEYKTYEYVKCIPLEDFITEYKTTNQNEKVLYNCIYLAKGLGNFKENELLSVILEDVYIFNKGKKDKYVLIAFEEFYTNSELEDMMYESSDHYKQYGESHYNDTTDEKIFEIYYDRILEHTLSNIEFFDVLDNDIDNVTELYADRINDLF